MTVMTTKPTDLPLPATTTTTTTNNQTKTMMTSTRCDVFTQHNTHREKLGYAGEAEVFWIGLDWIGLDWIGMRWDGFLLFFLFL